MASVTHISKKAKDAIAKVDSHQESKAKADTDVEKKKSKKGKKRKKTPAEEEDTLDEDTINIRDVLDPENEVDVPKSKKRKTDNKSQEPVETKVMKYPVSSPYRPVKQNDWLYHIAGVTISSCLKKAMDSSLDPRFEDEGLIKWREWSEDLFSESDLKKIWWYIRKQYPSESLEDVMKGLSGLSATSVEKLEEEATKKKYKHLAPKQPLSPYMVFYHRKNQKFLKKHPKTSQPDIARKMGEVWRQMTADEKKKYQDISRQKREAYKKELEKFYAKYPEAAPKKSKMKKSTTVSASHIVSLVVAKNAEALKKELPKAPLSPYIHFCMEMRPKYHKIYSHLQSVEITRKLGAKWSSMTPKEKEKYVAMKEKERESYDEKMKEFYAINPKIESLVKPKKSTKKKKSKAKSEEIVEEEEEKKEKKREEVEEDKDDHETSDDDGKGPTMASPVLTAFKDNDEIFWQIPSSLQTDKQFLEELSRLPIILYHIR
ncbi:PREDICTED: high mobility group B protein 13-like isoform X2 [Amphimedon queenslandica]|uniref:HMG box domain-containing protein n=1 Tax=Amphimedon queenslandica TaxID=400682 RepID=A0AAN0JEK1_AMPQE|nr:PREDICTED: high mobility group B protein 13-like isoform X2 [Amphimedon queenslandica]|eukprot:XP_019855192.1 PREDICTED: high mobility group B protein 13-like isoform X2 [Amphimedon queenslandica]